MNLSDKHIIKRLDYSENIILITIMLVDFCNYSCVYCIEELTKKHNCNFVDIELVFQFISYVHSLYADKEISIELYGGEPTLHPNILKLCKFLQSLSYINAIDIYTNFSASAELYQQLLNLNCHLSITYHASQCDKKKFLSKLRSFITYNISVNVMYEHDYIDESFHMHKFLLSLSSKYKNLKLELGLIFPTKLYVKTYTHADFLKFRLIDKIYNEKFVYCDIVENKQYIVSAYNMLNTHNCICSAGSQSMFISPDNFFYPCNMLYRTNHHKKSINDILAAKFEFTKTHCLEQCCYPCLPIKIELTTRNLVMS